MNYYSYSQKFLIGLITLLLIFNIGIFCTTNSSPIYWVHPELVTFWFFWSDEGIDTFKLHQGINGDDLLKPFTSVMDVGFRTRHVSYFFDMFSFKFWQNFEMGFFRNYNLIGLHLLNTMLLGLLVFYITRKKYLGLFCSLLFLNCGIALGTLLFPFRSAKVLVMTFFLLAWIIIAGCKQEFSKASNLRFCTFFLILLLASFTDEIFFFISPILFFYIYLRDGKDGLFNKRLYSGIFVYILLFLILTGSIIYLSKHLYDLPIWM